MIIKNENIVLRNIHAVYFLINIKQKYYEDNRSIVKINEVGKTIWELLDDMHTSDELINQIIKIYEIGATDIELIREDVASFLSNLQLLGYIKYE